MHQSVIDWVSEVARGNNFAGQSILEVGSLDVNGSVRGLFASAGNYIGIDFRPGPSVDVVMNSHDLGFPNESFDTVISTEVLEHDDEFWLSIGEMGRVLKQGGMMIITARGNGFMPHDYPADYWRFMPGSFEKLFKLARCQTLEIREDWQPGHPGVFGIGRKL